MTDSSIYEKQSLEGGVFLDPRLHPCLGREQLLHGVEVHRAHLQPLLGLIGPAAALERLLPTDAGLEQLLHGLLPAHVDSAHLGRLAGLRSLHPHVGGEHGLESVEVIGVGHCLGRTDAAFGLVRALLDGRKDSLAVVHGGEQLLHGVEVARVDAGGLQSCHLLLHLRLVGGRKQLLHSVEVLRLDTRSLLLGAVQSLEGRSHHALGSRLGCLGLCLRGGLAGADGRKQVLHGVELFQVDGWQGGDLLHVVGGVLCLFFLGHVLPTAHNGLEHVLQSIELLCTRYSSHVQLHFFRRLLDFLLDLLLNFCLGEALLLLLLGEVVGEALGEVAPVVRLGGVLLLFLHHARQGEGDFFPGLGGDGFLEGEIFLADLVSLELLLVEALLEQVREQVVVDPQLEGALLELGEVELVALEDEAVGVEALVDGAGLGLVEHLAIDRQPGLVGHEGLLDQQVVGPPPCLHHPQVPLLARLDGLAHLLHLVLQCCDFLCAHFQNMAQRIPQPFEPLALCAKYQQSLHDFAGAALG